MKITRKQLDELLQLITKSVLKEYSSMSSTDNQDADPGTADDGVKPQDAMTSMEKSKQKHDQMLKDKADLDKAKQQKITNKEKADSFKSQYDQWKRFERPNDDQSVKGLQQKVAGRSTTSSVAENIRKLRS